MTCDPTLVFMEEGGMSNRRQWRLPHGRCVLSEVDVEFGTVGNPDSREQSPDDRITKISKPFLEWATVDLVVCRSGMMRSTGRYSR